MLHGNLHDYTARNKLAEWADTTITALKDERTRVETLSMPKVLYQFESMLPGSTCVYCA